MSDAGILSRAAEVVRRFPSHRVLVVGDIMLDEYVFGTVGRISPEALEALKAQARRQAEDHLKNHLILEKIAKKEGFGVTEEEIQAEIRELAKANHVSEPYLADMLKREERREELVETLLFRKTVDFLVKTAIIS